MHFTVAGQAATFNLLRLLIAALISTCTVVTPFQPDHQLPLLRQISSSQSTTTTTTTTSYYKYARQTQEGTTLQMSLFGRGRRGLNKLRNVAARIPKSNQGSTNTGGGGGGGADNSGPTTPAASKILWEVYVDQSKLSLDRGGSATLDAFLGLAPPSTVKVMASTLQAAGAGGGASASAASGSSGLKKTKGPLVRCSSTDGLQCFDVNNVDSVDKVYRILTKHMQLSATLIPYKSCECLKWKYKGNAYLEAGKFDAAVDAYNEGLRMLASTARKRKTRKRKTQQQDGTDTCYDAQSGPLKQQEGILLLMRATAYLQRASSHKTKLKAIVKELMTMVPDAAKLKNLYEQTSGKDVPPSLSHSMFRRVLAGAAQQEESFRRTQYWHGLYQYALLQAAQDVLQATQLLPDYSRGWARAGEILSELWKSESAQYYEKAAQCDPSLQPQLKPVIDRLRKRQDLLESARAYGWSEDTLRLALDVAG